MTRGERRVSGGAGGLPPYDAIVLAGGAASRLGGADKPALRVGGRRLLDRVLDAVADAGTVVVVGPPRAGLPPHVVRVREEPPGTGPAAALAAGLAAVAAPTVAVLAADLPFVSAEVVAVLRAALHAGGAGSEGGDGVLLVDDAGAEQLLLGAWRTAALRRACLALPTTTGASLRRLLAPLAVHRIGLPGDGGPPPWWDCDTEDDLRRAEERA